MGTSGRRPFCPDQGLGADGSTGVHGEGDGERGRQGWEVPMRAGLGGPGVCPCTGWGPGPPDDWREKVPCTDESGVKHIRQTTYSSGFLLSFKVSESPKDMVREFSMTNEIAFLSLRL